MGKRYSNSYFLDLDKEVINLIYQEVIKNKIDKVIFLGDLFHDRSDSTPKTLVTARQILDQLNSLNIPIIMILGNHCTYYNNKKDYNYYRIFEGLFNNVSFIETIQEDGELLYVGWMQTPEEQAHYNNLAKNHKWIFGHFEFKGAEMSEFYKTKEGLENTNVNSYIFSGHIHQRSRQGKLHYIGSPYPHTWNGANRKDYGYVLIDTDTEEIKFTDLGLYHFNDYKLQKLLMRIHMDKEAVKKEMLNSETKIKIDVPLDERQLVDLKIYLNNTFKPKDLIVEKEDFTVSSENVSYDKLMLSSPVDFITDYISGMKIDEGQKGRIMEKVKNILT